MSFAGKRRRDTGGEIVQLAELLGDDRREPLRTLPKNHVIERPHQHA